MKLSNKIFILIIVILSIIMGIYMYQKEGFHEDEMFSYGSSNYRYDNVYQQFGRSDSVNIFIKEKIIGDSLLDTIKNYKYYYIDHKDEKESEINKIYEMQHPTWRTSKEAKEYIVIDKEDIFNYGMIYYNQDRDIHPPLFYFCVHTISILFYGTFSKYIIFILNLGFFIASLFIIKKIMNLLNREHLANLTILLYGLSMGAISTVIFQRMYMMLTFFILLYLYINLKIIKNDFEIDKKTWTKLTIVTILGYLTQLNFCIIAVAIAFVIFIGVIKKRGKKEAFQYIWNYIKIALLGIIIFPSNLLDILFSYRGIQSFSSNLNYFEKLWQYIDLIGYSFSIPVMLALVGFAVLSIFIIYKLIKEKNKSILKMAVLILPIFVYLLVIPKTAPNMEYKYAIRYIMCILPLIAIVITLMIDKIFKNKKHSIAVISIFIAIISICGFINSEPKNMFKGYNEYLKIAEEYKDNYFVFIGDTKFNQVQSMQEFMVYKESLILNEYQLEYLKNNENLEETNQFIVSIKKYLGSDELIKQVLEQSGYTSYEVLLNDNGDVGCMIYKVTK